MFYFFFFFFFFFKQKTAYEVLLCDWSSDVCSSDLDFLLELLVLGAQAPVLGGAAADRHHVVVREGLLYIVESPLVHGLNGRLERCLSGHQNDGGLRVLPAHG